MKTIKIGDDPSVYATGNDNCKTSTTGTSDQKPKELDLVKLSKNRIKGVIGEYASELNDWSFVEDRIMEEIEKSWTPLLTQQRTELKEIIDLMWDKKEADKNRYSVGWNSALAELEARLKIKNKL